jgi:hypothetical protein
MIRFVCFKDRLDCLALFARDGDPPVSIALEPPFTRERIREAARAANLDVRIVETAYVGRLKPVFDRMAADERAERKQQQDLRTATFAAVMRTSNNPIERSRAQLVQEKTDVDNELRSVKTKIGEARSNASSRGVYLPPADFRRLEKRLDALKNRSLAIQAELGQLRAQRRQENVAANASSDRLFREVAHECLSPEQFMQIVHEADRRSGAASASTEDATSG